MTVNGSVQGFEQAVAMVPSCTLGEDGRRSQMARYQTIATAIVSVRREPEVVVVDFDEQVAEEVVQDLVAAERECCPSLSFAFDPVTRRLSVTAADSAMLPALDPIAAAFAGVLR